MHTYGKYLVLGAVFFLQLYTSELLVAATVTAVPDKTVVVPGDIVTVRLLVRDAPASTSWGQLLRFDPSALRFVSQSAGDIATFVPDSRDLAAINASGEVRSGGFSFTPLANGTDGALVSMTFTVIGIRTTTLLDVVAKSDAEPFGCAFLNRSASSMVPTVRDATLTIGGGTQRVIRLQLTRGATVRPMSVTVDPDHGDAATVDGFSVFDDLVAELPYVFSLLESTNG